MGERKSSSKEKSSRKKRLKVSSKALHCRSGRAYLINKVSDFVNEEEEVNLNTMGEHKSSSKKNSSRMKRLNVSSKALHCSSGRAYRFNKVVNITFGENEERTLLSGTYTVKDIFCRICGQILGWKYEKSHEESQKYNEGKFVLERVKIIDDDDDEFYIDYSFKLK